MTVGDRSLFLYLPAHNTTMLTMGPGSPSIVAHGHGMGFRNESGAGGRSNTTPMAWETRKRGGACYIRSRRLNGRVIREYIGLRPCGGVRLR
jgi:hypothetical protein